MNNIKRDPFKDILFLQNRINKLLDNAVTRPICFMEMDTSYAWTPPVDIYETDIGIVLKAEVPGMDEEHIIVEVKGNILILKGERKLKKDMHEENFHRIERYYGSFQRRFNLPSTIDKDKMKAHYKDGVLELILPKKKEKDKKIIRVNYEKDSQ